MCYQTAITNALFYLEKTYNISFSDKISPEHRNRSWLEKMEFMLEDIYFNFSMIKAKETSEDEQLERYINERYRRFNQQQNNITPSYALVWSQLTRGDTTYNHWPGRTRHYNFSLEVYKDRCPYGHSGCKSYYNYIYENFTTNKDPVIALIGLAPNTWWAGHFVTIAGVEDSDEKQLWIADPDNTPYGSGWGKYYKKSDPLPTGKNHYQKITLDDRDRIIDGPYTGGRIFHVRIIRVHESLD